MFADHVLWNTQKKFQLNILKIITAFCILNTCRNVQKVKVKKYRMEKTPNKVFKWRRNLHVA